MMLQTAAARLSLHRPSRSCAAAQARPHEQPAGAPATDSRLRLAAGLFASIAASLILALLVAVAAAAMEQPAVSVWEVEDATSAAPESAPWCAVLNGRTICVGEPN